MQNNNHLWKDIGLHDEAPSPDSSSFKMAHPQLKGYKMEFDNFSQSSQPSQDIFRIHRVDSIKSSQGPNQQIPSIPPMVFPTEFRDRNGSEEQVIEAISFESESEQKMGRMNSVLNSIKEESYNNAFASNRKSMGEQKLQKMKAEEEKKVFLRQKVGLVVDNVLELKNELDQYKMYLLDVLSHWEITAIKDCQKMTCSIDRRFGNLVETREKVKEENVRNSIQMTQQNNGLHEQLQQLRIQLQNEVVKGKQYKKQICQLQYKLASQLSSPDLRLQREEQGNINQSFLSQQLLKVEKERDDLRVQKQEYLRQLTKTKGLFRDKQHEIELLNEENNNLLKQISMLKSRVQDSGSRERKLDMKMQLQIQQHKVQTSQWEKEAEKGKQETFKLRELLKNSEEQLRQCQSYIISVSSKIKTQQDNSSKLSIRLKEEQNQYSKKLQNFDTALSEIQKNIEEMWRNQESKIEQVRNKEAELEKVIQELQNRQFDLKQKQYEIEELRKELRHETYMLERREEGMRAEYKMAVDVQNATKDKWYQRYYQLTSDREDSSKYGSSPSLARQTLSGNFLPRPLFKKSTMNPPVWEKPSPTKTILTKARSEQNLYLGSPRRMHTSRKTEMMIPECYRDNSITSRINNLRTELSKELNQINNR